MNIRIPKVNFSKGELGPQLYGRFDADVWQSASKKARNVIILKYGGLTKRPGLRLVDEVVDDSEEQRLIPFEFSLDQTYALEFGQALMSPCALGGRVLEEELKIFDISAAANAQIEIPFHGYEVGDRIYITGVANVSGAPDEEQMGFLLNDRWWTVVSVVDVDNFTINADTTGRTFVLDTGDGITRTEAPSAPSAPTVPEPVAPPPPPPTTPNFDDYFRLFF